MFVNPHARPDHDVRHRPDDPSAFHRSLPCFTGPTPLVALPSAANRLGVGQVHVKVESSRLGLPSFKILGASWAIHSLLCQRLALDPASTPFDRLRDEISRRRVEVAVYTATDGNHGRAVARMARLLKLRAHVFVPSNVTPASRALIASEGADVHPVEGDYDASVRLASETCAGDVDGLLVQDTSWEGYEDVPMRIVDGYSTLFREIDDQLSPNRPDVVVVPVGVGSLAHAAVLHYRSSTLSTRPTLVTVEPVEAACLQTSLRRGKMTSIETGETIMPGLCCGTVSPVAWPDLVSSVSVSVSVEDADVRKATSALWEEGLDVGPCGAAPLAALEVLRSERRLGRDAVVVLVCTEGSEVYRQSI